MSLVMAGSRRESIPWFGKIQMFVGYQIKGTLSLFPDLELMCIPLFCVNFWMILVVPNSGYPRKFAAWPNQRCSKNLGNEYDPIRQATTGTGQNWRHIGSTSFFCESSSGPLFEPPCFVFCRNCAIPHHAWKITLRLYDAGFHCIIHTPCGCFLKRNVNPWVFPWSMTTYMVETGCLGFALKKRWGCRSLHRINPVQTFDLYWCDPLHALGGR